jgi:polar amino acid transport system substrate-binding protein
MLQQGEVSAVSAGKALLAGMAAEDPRATVLDQKLASHAYGIGIGKKHLHFVRFVNAVLEEVRSGGRWQHSYRRWFGDQLGATPAPPAPHYV